MALPTIQGVIGRRLLINYRVDPEVIARLLPAPFRPKLVGDWAVAGICLIRLEHIRPVGIPSVLGFSSENAAHRIAVEWGHGEQRREGVYIPRRDTNSRLTTIVGGRIFPGIHHHALITAQENGSDIRITISSVDGTMRVVVAGRPTASFQPTPLFHSLADASAFFERGSVGYSATLDADRFDGLELRTGDWRVEPFAIDQLQSSFFEDRSCFPRGSATLDCALLMRNIPHRWHELQPLCSPVERAG